MKMNLPSYIEAVLSRLESAGYEAFVVGGAVRDTLLGKTPWDYDITTSAAPKELLTVFADFEYYTAGLKHGTLSVLIENHTVEITTFRVDGTYTDARHPDAVTFSTSLREDLARRDFTVNAMAYRPEGRLVDPFGGVEDLKNRRIRAVGVPDKRFAEDALRILRAFRFSSKLGFSIEKETLEGIRRTRGGLCHIAAERISAELCGILVGGGAYESLCLMKETGVLAAVAPALEGGLERGLSVLPERFPVRAAYLLRHASKEAVTELLYGLRLSHAVTAHIETLLSLWPFAARAESDYEIRVLTVQSGAYFDDLCALVARRELAEAAAHFRARGDCLDKRTLAVKGDDLLARGLRGPAIGEALDFLFDEVLRDPEQNKTSILLKKLDKLTH